MLRSILIALDGVTPDAAALFCAGELAGAQNAALRVVICPNRGDFEGGEAHGIGGSSFAQRRDTVLTQRLQERLQAERSGLVELLTQSGIVPEIIEAVGDPPGVVAAASECADLVVLPHGRPRARAEDDTDTGFVLPVPQILQELVRPALLVADSAIGEGPVVIAYDGSPGAQRALHTGLLSGMFGRREVVVLSVGYGLSAAESMAAPAAELIRHHGHAVRVEALSGQGGTAGAILSRLDGLAPALFVSGSFGGHGLLEWLFGGTTEHLLPAVQVPWLVQR
ncbi:universal stress protein [Geminicoccus flavidas]|uniref:universal stress protein n=1 Tax=Geminicoccus flavidas TaxID=2506407 RepID=UPI00135B1F07|nr:universal stress protein [Geminicoccus flavidas]